MLGTVTVVIGLGKMGYIGAIDQIICGIAGRVVFDMNAVAEDLLAKGECWQVVQSHILGFTPEQLGKAIQKLRKKFAESPWGSSTRFDSVVRPQCAKLLQSNSASYLRRNMRARKSHRKTIPNLTIPYLVVLGKFLP